jgi:hypothetical protein
LPCLALPCLALPCLACCQRQQETNVAFGAGMAPSVSHALRTAERVQRVVFVSCNPHGTVLRTGRFLI